LFENEKLDECIKLKKMFKDAKCFNQILENIIKNLITNINVNLVKF